jgi:hypothetical protein
MNSAKNLAVNTAEKLAKMIGWIICKVDLQRAEAEPLRGALFILCSTSKTSMVSMFQKYFFIPTVIFS